MTPFQESEDIQDFLEAFEGIMGIQNVDRTEWVLRLTPLLNGKARAVELVFRNTTIQYTTHSVQIPVDLYTGPASVVGQV